MHRRQGRREFLKSASALAMGSVLHGQSTSASTRTIQDTSKIFDFVIVGSGAGGGVVAARLVEAGFRVVVIEAGDNHENDNYRVPAFHLKSSADPSFSWNFYVQHYSGRGQHGRRYVDEKGGMLYPRAATLGGCTAHHAMLMLMPGARDWQTIVDATKDISWSPEFMGKYLDRLRQWLPIEITSPALLLKDHALSRIITAAAIEGGTAGRLLQMLPNLNPGQLDVLKQFSLDPNTDSSSEGLFMVPQSTDQGRRVGTRERLLDVQQTHPEKLTIVYNTLATKLILGEADSQGNRRTLGVECQQREHLYRADPLWQASTDAETAAQRVVYRASREVILAGGAFNSPQLLQLSGVGPEQLLRKHHIPVKLDRPGVGKNLQDRYEVAVVNEFDKPHDILADCEFGGEQDPCLIAYNKGGANRNYASNGLLVGIKKTPSGGRSPELFVFGSPTRFEGYAPGFETTAVESGRHFTWAILKGYSQNTSGSVEIRSSSPFETPAINFRYFNDGQGGESDLQAVREGIALARRINQRSRSLAWLDSRRDTEVVPGAHMMSDEQLNEHIRREAWGHHASCSNKMGAKDDPTAVVDGRCRVYGVDNLRIVDASVFPRIPGLFIVMPLYLLAEKAADDIISDNRQSL